MTTNCDRCYSKRVQSSIFVNPNDAISRQNMLNISFFPYDIQTSVTVSGSTNSYVSVLSGNMSLSSVNDIVNGSALDPGLTAATPYIQTQRGKYLNFNVKYQPKSAQTLSLISGQTLSLVASVYSTKTNSETIYQKVAEIPIASWNSVNNQVTTNLIEVNKTVNYPFQSGAKILVAYSFVPLNFSASPFPNISITAGSLFSMAVGYF